jgi:phosphate transport system protein
MARSRFDQELDRLKDNVLVLGTEVQKNITRGASALVNRDVELANELIKADEWVNQQQVQLNMDVMKLMATQQPVARDMRFVASLMGIVAELERIHDYVKDTGMVTNQIHGYPIPRELMIHFPEIAGKSADMLKMALDAFRNNDLEQAQNTPDKDAEVEALYFASYRLFVTYTAEHIGQIDAINRLEWSLHSLARIADRTINICEWAIYIMTGEMVEIPARHRPPLVADK